MFGISTDPYFDRSVLVTSATSGLGPDIVRALVRRGARPIAVARDQIAISRLSEKLGGSVVTLARDLADTDAPVAIARWIVDEHRDLAGMICNADATGRSRLNGRLIAPLSVLGHLAALLPRHVDLRVGLVVQDPAPRRDLARISNAVRGFDRKASLGICLTVAAHQQPLEEADTQSRRLMAETALDAMTARQAFVLLGGKGGWPGRWRGARNAGKAENRLA